MADLELKNAVGSSGPGGRVLHATTQNLSNGDTYDTGLDHGVDQAVCGGVNAGHIVNVTNKDGSGVITLSIEDDSGSAQSNVDVDILAFGQP